MAGNNAPPKSHTETAYAKINLALHVRARRADSYHDLETLFAFVDQGDRLTMEISRSDEPELILSGPFAAALEGESNNLVLEVAHDFLEFARNCNWQPKIDYFVPKFHLEKNLPVAAGIGGGSADAAAAARLLSTAFKLFDPKELAFRFAALGADIPACIVSKTRVGRGIGAMLELPEKDDLLGQPVLLVNPGIAVYTGPVFAGWDGIDRGALADGSALEIAVSGRNDLEFSACKICPEIGTVLDQLLATRPLVSRMSGSGATCFALYRTEAERDEAQKTIGESFPDWWNMAGKLR